MVWKYFNHSLGLTGVLYTCNGSVRFSSFSHTTDWHGSWESEPGEGDIGSVSVKLNFNSRGDPERLRSCLLFMYVKDVEGNHMLMTGYDYAGRRVSVTQLDRYQWCNTCASWARLDPTLEVRLAMNDAWTR